MMDYWNLSLMFVVLFPSVGLVASAHHIMFYEASGDQTGCKQANQIIQSTLFGRSARSEPTACAQDPQSTAGQSWSTKKTTKKAS